IDHASNADAEVFELVYDDPEVILDFHQEWDIPFPLLRDVDGQHVDAWGIRNVEYEEGSFAYGIPYPGIVLIAPDGEILAKYAEEGYRSRADWATVLADVRAVLEGE
ncbi:MAG: redoxin domain-containing protein, partial [Pseudomonadota bacterium]